MKKLAIAITSLLLITGCSSTPTITNTKNIKEYILKDNVAYDSFSSYSDSDTIIRLPNGEYIHGTKEVMENIMIVIKIQEPFRQKKLNIMLY